MALSSGPCGLDRGANGGWRLVYPQIVAELPAEVRGSQAFPAVIDAILRELEEGRNMEQLRKAGVLEVGSWLTELG